MSLNAGLTNQFVRSVGAAGGDIVAPLMASQPSTTSLAGHVTIERACRHGSSANQAHLGRPYGITIDGEYF